MKRNDDKNIILEDVLSEKYLLEMGQVYPKGKQGQFSILVGYSPETANGNCYFKVYNHPSKYDAATKVIRIGFKEPIVITGHKERNGKAEWKIDEFSESYKKDLVEYLNSPSKTNSNISVWTQIRFEWNMMKQFDIEDINEYISGKSDKKYLSDPNYVPYDIQIPDYINSLHCDKRR